MFAPQNTTGVIETRVLALTNNLTSVVGLLVFGFPVSSAAIGTMAVSWVMIAVGIMQFVLGVLQTRSVPGSDWNGAHTIGDLRRRRPCASA